MIKIKHITIEEKQAIIRKILQGKLKKKEARQILSCSRQTLYRYLLHARERGIASIVDNRHGNNRKLTIEMTHHNYIIVNKKFFKMPIDIRKIIVQY